MKKKIPAWLVLTVICIAAAALLGVTNLLTKDVISDNALREAMATKLALLPETKTFEDLENGISVGKDSSGKEVGYTKSALTQGFGGEIEVTAAARPDGTIAGISVGGSNFAETAGLGARAKEPEFQAQFAGKKAPVSLSKDGGEIDALTGATITSRAVIKGVNEAMAGIAEVAGFTVESTSTFEDLGNATYAATAAGFGGPVKVTVSMKPDRSIAAITIGDESFAETPGLGARALEAEYREQFIGKTLPLNAQDVDILTGATITSTAVMDAIAQIDEGIGDSVIPEADFSVQEDATITENETAGKSDAASSEAVTNPNEYSAKAQGFMGHVKVTVTLDEEKKISSIEIGDEEFAETPGLGATAKEESFRNQFIGKSIPVEAGDIDAISGATITTNAVLEALKQIAADVNAGGAEAETAEAPAAAANEYSAKAQGFMGPVKVTVTLDEEKKISSIEIGDEEFAETPGLGATAKEESFRNQFIGKSIPVEAGDIDAISGATITTNAVLEAIREIAEAVK